jgi:hypothetical protein
MGISFHRDPAGEPGRGLIYRGLREMDEGGSRNGAFLSEEARCGGPLGRAPLLGTLEDTLRKALDTGISLHWGPFISEGNLDSGGGGLVYRGLCRSPEGGLYERGISLRGDSMRGTWREGSFTGDLEGYVKEVYEGRCKNSQ